MQSAKTLFAPRFCSKPRRYTFTSTTWPLNGASNLSEKSSALSIFFPLLPAQVPISGKNWKKYPLSRIAPPDAGLAGPPSSPFATLRNLTCKELWVYAGATDQITIKFYASLGFELLGPALAWAPRQTMHDSDLVFETNVLKRSN